MGIRMWSALLGLCLSVSATAGQPTLLTNEALETPLAYGFLQATWFSPGEVSQDGFDLAYDHSAATVSLPLTQRVFVRGAHLRQTMTLTGDDGEFVYEDTGALTEAEALVGMRFPVPVPGVALDLTAAAGHYRLRSELGAGMQSVHEGSGTTVDYPMGFDVIEKGWVGEVGVRTDLGLRHLDVGATYRFVKGQEDWRESGARVEIGLNLSHVTLGYEGRLQRDEPADNLASVTRHGVFLRLAW